MPEIVTLPTGVAEFDISRDGTLVYVAGSGDTHAPRTLVWVDRQGVEHPVGAPPRLYANVALSPDGTRIATEIEDLDNDIWIWHLRRETLTRVTGEAGADESPIWMPDGRRFVFTSQVGGALGSLFWQAADGSGRPERLSQSDRVQRATDVLPDGSGVLFSDGDSPSLLRLNADRRVERLPRPQQYGGGGAISPDGRWVAYMEIDNRMPQAFVSAWSEPKWASNGRELFYRSLDGAVMSAPTRLGTTLTVGAPTRIINPPYFGGLTLFSRLGTYDLSPDGQRFLMIKPTAPPDGAPRAATVVVVRNWSEELKGLGRATR